MTENEIESFKEELLHKHDGNILLSYNKNYAWSIILPSKFHHFPLLKKIKTLFSDWRILKDDYYRMLIEYNQRDEYFHYCYIKE